MPKSKERDVDAKWSFLDDPVFELVPEGKLHHFCRHFRDALSEQEQALIDLFGRATFDDSADPELQASIHSAYDNICRALDSVKKAIIDFNKDISNVKKRRLH
jgi:hypothetical protein